VYAGPDDEDELGHWYETGGTDLFHISVLLLGKLLDRASTASFSRNSFMSAFETDLIKRAGYAVASSLAVLPVGTEEDTDDDNDKPSDPKSGSRTGPAGGAA
jgi:hypothetical protein